MAFYNIETDSIDPTLRLDPAIVSLISEDLPSYDFKDELRVMDELIDDLVEETAESGESAETASSITGTVEALGIVASDEVAATNSSVPLTNVEDTKQIPVSVTTAEKGTKSSGIANAKEVETTIPLADSVVAANDDVSSSQPHVKVEVEIAESLNGNGAPQISVGSPAMVTSLNVTEKGHSSGVDGDRDAIAAVAAFADPHEEEMDPNVRKILENDKKVTAMCERTKLSRTDCFFYLESADHDLEAAIRLYESLVIQ